MEKVILDASKANAVISYLQTKPYKEVAQLLAIIQQSVVKDSIQEMKEADGAPTV